jgi:ParB-like chromosome segregation protein Spo0J
MCVAASERIESVAINDIKVVDERRPVDKKKMRMIAESISTIGLRTPLTVRQRNNGGIVLVAGLHRLEAAKSLHWEKIDCFVVADTKIQRQLWMIAENVHRANLTKLQRSEAIAQWGKLIKKPPGDGQVAHPGGDQPSDKGINKVAKGLDLSRESVRRATRIAGISASAKAAAGSTIVRTHCSQFQRSPTPLLR